MIEFKNLTIEENINLGKMTTMQLGGKARFFAKVNSIDDVQAGIQFAKENSLPIFVLGGGSNTIVRDEGFEGLVLKNEFLGVKQVDEDDSSKTFELGSGENWDKFCHWSVEQGLSGCEAMVMIPGTVGALPVQNVGAYGQETISIFESCEVINLKTGNIEVLGKEQCRLRYRSSIFREEKVGEYFIISVKLKLFKKQQKIPLYFSVEEYFKNHSINPAKATSAQIMEAVIFLRSEKLPDPKDIPSAGSFFKNVEIPDLSAKAFIAKFPDAVIFPSEKKGFSKIPTGWLIDKAGLRGKIIHGMRPHDKNALILTNVSAKTYADLAAARAKIQQEVKNKFGFEIEQEPLEI
ncbi:MAG: UDP-N-acetylmuramate dehydrogenase [bacterium]|nr:UDP-N-acetylmuramate dehydrogenase [bacterium]